MSRIGQSPVNFQENVEVNFENKLLRLKGPKGLLEMQISNSVDVKIDENNILVENKDNTQKGKANWGTTRALINNMVIGVSVGFEKKLELIGVGYRAKASGKLLELTLGFSHPVKYQLPDEVEVETPSQTEVVLKSHNKQILGQAAAEIRSFRPPEPYKGKGVRYADEHVKRKEAKKAAGAGA